MKPPTKPPLPDRLSKHLLNEARRFQIFPNRQRRTKLNLEVQKLFDRIGQQLITERETFMQPDSLAATLTPDRTSQFFDELYSRRLLEAIPEIVERTQQLKSLSLPAMPKGDSLTYLREASRTYVMGFFTASIALSRSALEAAVTSRGQKLLGFSAVEGMELLALIDRTLGREPDERRLAHQVRKDANEVIHNSKLATNELALRILEDTRTVVGRCLK